MKSLASMLLSFGVCLLLMGAGWVLWHRDVGFGAPLAAIGLILLAVSAILFIRLRHRDVT